MRREGGVIIHYYYRAMMELGLWRRHRPGAHNIPSHIERWARDIVIMILSFLSQENRFITINLCDRPQGTWFVINLRLLRCLSYCHRALRWQLSRKQGTGSDVPPWRVLPHYPSPLWKARTKQNQATSWTKVIQTRSRDRQNHNYYVMPALDGSRAISCGYDTRRELHFPFMLIACQ